MKISCIELRDAMAWQIASRLSVNEFVCRGCGCAQLASGSTGGRLVHILLAEDEALIAMTLADWMEADGHTVMPAADGAEALEVARTIDAVDLLVTDLRMPRLDGEGLIRALWAERPGLPVIVVTGSAPVGGASALCRGCGDRGPIILLHKPLDHTVLAQAVQRINSFVPATIAIERKFGIPDGHTLRRVRCQWHPQYQDQLECEHEEYDADGVLVAIYESWTGSAGSDAILFVKYSPTGWVLHRSRSLAPAWPPSDIGWPDTRYPVGSFVSLGFRSKV